jgi:hypothetical protein
VGRAKGPREKRFTYADRLGHSQEEHVEHWRGFEFEAGPFVVRAKGIWGECQCWAASEEEGRRLIRHGLVFGGFDPDDPAQGAWQVGIARGRGGQPGLYRINESRYGMLVSKRQGPNGAPDASWVFQGTPDPAP